MKEENELLDDQVGRNQLIPELKHRGWVIFFAWGGMIVGLLSLFGFAYNVNQSIARLRIFVDSYHDINWFRLFLGHGFSFMFGVTSLVGGLGLLLKKRFGWSLSLSSSMSVGLIPILVVAMQMYNSRIRLANPGVLMWCVVAFFTIIASFLLWGPIRRQFSPKPTTYFVLVSTLIVHILLFSWLPLTQH